MAPRISDALPGETPLEKEYLLWFNQSRRVGDKYGLARTRHEVRGRIAERYWLEDDTRFQVLGDCINILSQTTRCEFRVWDMRSETFLLFYIAAENIPKWRAVMTLLVELVDGWEAPE